jgi:UPF0755 protein
MSIAPPAAGDGGAAPNAVATLATMAPSVAAFGASSSAPAAGAAQAASAVSLGPTLDSLGLTVDETATRGKDVMDGPADDPAPGSVDPAYMPGGAAANAARNGASRPGALPMVNGHPRIVDASVGTPLDPLKNTTWDLNSPKTVPKM